MYNPDNAVERKIPESGTVVEAIIVAIPDGKVKDFVTGEGLKKFDNPEGLAIQVISEGSYEGKVFQCKTLFSFELINNIMEYDARSNLAHFKTQYGSLPKVGQKVKHIANAKGYFKLIVKV